MTQSDRPVTIFSGFLGSGKTTIISHLIDELSAQGVKLAYIKNELGDLDLDAQLMKGKNIASKEMLNGCICCTITGPFTNAIDELIATYHPDRILIESAGTADPASLALMIKNHPGVVNDGVITVIDVLNFEGYEDLSQVARRQAEFTDLVIFNKVELADDATKRAVVGYVRELQPDVPIVEAVNGRIEPSLVIGISPAEVSETDFHHDHLEDDLIQAIELTFDQPFHPQKLTDIFKELPANVIRIKGVVSFPDGQQTINGVFRRFDLFDQVPEGFVEQGKSKLICIGYQVEQQQSALVDFFGQAVV